jgi:hypothetical protein
MTGTSPTVSVSSIVSHVDSSMVMRDCYSSSGICELDTSILYNSRVKPGLRLKFYAVCKGYRLGIYFTWEDCSTQVNGFSS